MIEIMENVRWKISRRGKNWKARADEDEVKQGPMAEVESDR